MLVRGSETPTLGELVRSDQSGHRSEAWIFREPVQVFIPFLIRFKVRDLGRKMLLSDPLPDFLQNHKLNVCSTV